MSYQQLFKMFVAYHIDAIAKEFFFTLKFDCIALKDIFFSCWEGKSLIQVFLADIRLNKQYVLRKSIKIVDFRLDIVAAYSLYLHCVL